MKTLYRITLLSALSLGLFISCGDSDSCDNYTGPALKKLSSGGCYYEENGTTVTYTDPEKCQCAK